MIDKEKTITSTEAEELSPLEAYDFEFRVKAREDRRAIAAILVDNGYDVGCHKRKRTPTGKSVDYYIHALDISARKDGEAKE